MNNAISMSAEFERQKNLRASVLTAISAGLILMVVILIKLTTPIKVEPPIEEFVEISLPNLGSSDIGMGKDQPQLPGDPAPAQQTAYTPPQASRAAEEAVKDVSNDDEKSNDAPPVTKPLVNKKDATKINEQTKTVKTTNTTPTPPAPRQTKAVLGKTVGGNGNGGNGADTYKPGTGEGQGGGPGDQGVNGGDPNGKKYTGNPRNLGIKTYNIPAQNFEDDFSESGKIALDIVVSETGKLISASYQPRGSTLSNRNQIEIAKRRAGQINYPKYDGGFKQTIVMNFQVRS